MISVLPLGLKNSQAESQKADFPTPYEELKPMSDTTYCISSVEPGSTLIYNKFTMTLRRLFAELTRLKKETLTTGFEQGGRRPGATVVLGQTMILEEIAEPREEYLLHLYFDSSLLEEILMILRVAGFVIRIFDRAKPQAVAAQNMQMTFAKFLGATKECYEM